MIGDAFITAVLYLVLFVLLALLHRIVHGEGLAGFQFHADGRGRRLFLTGAAFGAAGIVAYAGLVLMAGRGHLTFTGGTVAATAATLAAWSVGFLAVAVLEEALFRGYLLQKLLPRVPRAAAIGIPSLLFGLSHWSVYAGSPTRWLGIANAGLMGVLLSLAVLDCGSLMPAVGFHWAWNLVQQLLLPGGEGTGSLLVGLDIRDGVWAGTAEVAESGLAATLALLLLGAVSAGLWRRAIVPAVDDVDRPSA